MLSEHKNAGTGDELGILAAAPKLAHTILGTSSAAEVRHLLNGFCSVQLDSKIEEILLCELSVGAAFGARLADGRRVLVKAHPPARTPGFLRAVHRVQTHLFRSGFPCPRPVATPAPLGLGFATTEDFVDAGDYADAHDPQVRRESAETLAWLVQTARTVTETDGLHEGWNRPSRGKLWPEPHNAFFDFAATVPGSGWIEGIAARTKSILDRFQAGTVVGHADWCSKHLRFEGGKASVVYDWDSLRLDVEPAIAGGAAVTFPANRHLDVSNLPTPEETWLFVEDYETTRGHSFSPRERPVVTAAAIYTFAYLARCEHAADPESSGSGDYRSALQEHTRAYFSTECLV